MERRAAHPLLDSRVLARRDVASVLAATSIGQGISLTGGSTAFYRDSGCRASYFLMAGCTVAVLAISALLPKIRPSSQIPSGLVTPGKN